MATRDPMQDTDMSHAIKNCTHCHNVCLETLHYCLNQKKNQFTGKHIELLQMCADACDLALKMMIADMESHHQSCQLCLELCTACDDACEAFPNDAEMRRCAAICRRCAESCRGTAGLHRTISADAQDQKPRGTAR